MRTTVVFLCLTGLALSNECLQFTETEDGTEEAAETSDLRTQSCLFKKPLSSGWQENCLSESEDLEESIITQFISRLLKDFRPTLFESEDSQGLISRLIRELFSTGKEVTIVNAESLRVLNQQDYITLRSHLWRKDSVGDTAIVMYISKKNADNIFTFLEESKFWYKPESHVVLLGAKGSETFLGHPSLRNVLHLIYIGLSGRHILGHQSSCLKTHHSFKKTKNKLIEDKQQFVRVYRRCLYCRKNKSRIASLSESDTLRGSSPLRDEIFSDQLRDLKGHEIRVTALPYFPFSDIVTSEGGTVAADSLDTRVLEALSATLNFTYVIRPPRDGKWGIPLPNGSWSGIIGTLARQEADMSFLISPDLERLKVVDMSGEVAGEHTVLMTKKPSPLPKHLALLRPFSVDVWAALMVFVILITSVVWILWRARCSFAGGRPNSLSESFVIVWSTLLQNSDLTPVALTDKIMMGFWVIGSFVLSSAYQSSLVAHLTVTERSQPINSLEDLTRRKDWKWAAEPAFFTSKSILAFEAVSEPAVKKFLSKVQEMDIEVACQRVLEENLAMLTWHNYVRSIISNEYSDAKGRNPYHLGPAMFGDMRYAWAFRKGAPFQSRFRDLLQRLFESGFMDHNLKKVDDERRIRRQKSTFKRQTVIAVMEQDQSDSTVVLDLNHLQGAFYALILGLIVATVVFVAEKGGKGWKGVLVKRAPVLVDARKKVALRK
ncbi:glutamate receptor ionotropic, delta-2-like [Macrobrachium rosenbergii]|uniref:glutamate receptor ionotropic, delta-2-like n=1 Tax=Macrobrachium rosenbergii TaxID=79674 RepID=UPI0034D5284A